VNEPATQQARCGERVGPDERERLGPAALRVEGLAKAYRGGAIPVFSGLSLSVPQGQRLAIIGANGSGKSTLLRCCLRLIEPDQGRVFMTGQELTGLGRRELRRVRARVGMVFQRHQLVPELSVLSNVLHGALGRRSGPRVRRPCAASIWSAWPSWPCGRCANVRAGNRSASPSPAP
jgi:ATPase subunit of ABC transporter with duplicated ATPase domains